jgi:hypothetical protein
MSTENPILDALQTSVIINRRDQPGQIAWTEWRANVAFGCPAPPGSIVMTGASGTIDPCLLPPPASSLLIEVNGVPTPDQNVANFIAGVNIVITADAFGGIRIDGASTASTSFSAISSGTNTVATMVVGTGATLTFSGTGVVNANQIQGVAISAVPPTPGQVLTATSATTAAFQTPSSGTMKVTAVINFVNADGPEDTTATVTVTGQTWVTAASVIIAAFDGTTADHEADDAMVEDLSAYVENIVPGVGFDITAHAPLGTWGRYAVYAQGVA